MSILYDFHDALRTGTVLVPWPAALALKAGAPLDADGAVSNDGDAIGILLNNGDVGKTVVINGAAFIECEILMAGYLDRDAAEASCGLTYSDALIAGLSHISFVAGGTLPSSGGGGGGALPADVIIKVNFNEEGEYVSTEVLKSDPNILQRFLSDPSSVRPFVFKHITEISDSMYPFVSVFNYDGPFSIIAYDMYVRGSLPTFVHSEVFIYEDGTWVYD